MQTTLQVEHKPRIQDAGKVENTTKMHTKDFAAYYREFRAITDVNLPIYAQKITAIIGPSGCGKSTLLRAMNRMNDLVKGSHVEGQVYLDGEPLYESNVDVVEVRRRLAELHEDRESERAYTSIVEVLASESENHAMLAEIRESQNRWAEAIAQWRHAEGMRAALASRRTTRFPLRSKSTQASSFPVPDEEVRNTFSGDGEPTSSGGVKVTPSSSARPAMSRRMRSSKHGPAGS